MQPHRPPWLFTIAAVLSWIRTHLRRSAWLALGLMLSLAVVPTLSHAIALSAGAALPSDVCSVQDALALASDTTAPTASHHLDHCPLCGVAAHGAPPPAPLVFTLVAAPATSAPALFWVAPRPLHAWASAPSRAPPLI